MNDQICINCVMFDPLTDEANLAYPEKLQQGYCRNNSPVIVPNPHLLDPSKQPGAWPLIYAFNWCGSFCPKAEESW